MVEGNEWVSHTPSDNILRTKHGRITRHKRLINPYTLRWRLALNDAYDRRMESQCFVDHPVEMVEMRDFLIQYVSGWVCHEWSNQFS